MVSLPKWLSACLHGYYVSAASADLSWNYVFIPSEQGFHVIAVFTSMLDFLVKVLQYFR